MVVLPEGDFRSMSPHLAKIIRVTLSDSSPLLVIQQAVASTRTERGTAAASDLHSELDGGSAVSAGRWPTWGVR
jgi:hypothetical protein